jgi:methyltransferase (TIGR00027 family)
MKEARPSLTAGRVAILRAAHQRFDDPRVFDDPLAIAILGPVGAERLARSGALSRTAPMSGLRAWIVARSRFAEEELANARGRGVGQYVVLGAGLDTFAYRAPPGPRPLEVFEVDHPATQAWKQRSLSAASIPVPPSVHFVPSDFETGRLAIDLASAGFRSDSPAFFGWLGVTMYLTRPAVEAMLDFLATMAPSGGVVLDYFDRTARAGTVHRLARGLLARRMALSGEPFRSAFDPGELSRGLRERGFASTEDLGAAEVNARYFEGRSDHLRVTSPVGRLVRAVR